MGQLLTSWGSLYSNSAVLRTLIGFAHVAGLLIGGGAAIAADRAALTIGRRTPAQRSELLASIRSTHAVVIGGLAVVGVSGLLLLGADTETLLRSRIFWAKMGMIVLLLGNGVLVMQAERSAAAGVPRGWASLRWTAGVSLALWFLTTLAGAALLNVG